MHTNNANKLTDIDISTLVVLEFNPLANGFHQSTVPEVIKGNILSILKKTPSDWIPVGIFTEMAVCDHYAEMYHPHRESSEAVLQFLNIFTGALIKAAPFNNILALEYSPIQEAFHRSTIVDMLSNNILAVQKQLRNGYIPIGFFHSIEDCDVAFKKFDKLFRGEPEFSNLTVDELLRNCG